MKGTQPLLEAPNSTLGGGLEHGRFGTNNSDYLLSAPFGVIALSNEGLYAGVPGDGDRGSDAIRDYPVTIKATRRQLRGCKLFPCRRQRRDSLAYGK